MITKYFDVGAHLLKKSELKPRLKKTWYLGQIDAKFIAQMEEILWLFALPYDPEYLMGCFDERPSGVIFKDTQVDADGTAFLEEIK